MVELYPNLIAIEFMLGEAQMSSSSLRREILEGLNELGEQEQTEVLDLIKRLKSSRPKGTSGVAFARLASGIEKSDLLLMSEAIEYGCERIDPSDW